MFFLYLSAKQTNLSKPVPSMHKDYNVFACQNYSRMKNCLAAGNISSL